jgi:hypothetical protein
VIIPDIFCQGLSGTPPGELAYSAEPGTGICESAASLSRNCLALRNLEQEFVTVLHPSLGTGLLCGTCNRNLLKCDSSL